MQWKKIETAPQDGTVILTDEGLARFEDRLGWLLCDRSGYVPSCTDYGREVSQISPAVWCAPPKIDYSKLR